MESVFFVEKCITVTAKKNVKLQFSTIVSTKIKHQKLLRIEFTAGLLYATAIVLDLSTL